jgi:hypothetical protein
VAFVRTEGVKPKMMVRKLICDVNWQGELKRKRA